MYGAGPVIQELLLDARHQGGIAAGRRGRRHVHRGQRVEAGQTGRLGRRHDRRRQRGQRHRVRLLLVVGKVKLRLERRQLAAGRRRRIVERPLGHGVLRVAAVQLAFPRPVRLRLRYDHRGRIQVGPV